MYAIIYIVKEMNTMKKFVDKLINRYGFEHWSVRLFARFVK